MVLIFDWKMYILFIFFKDLKIIVQMMNECWKEIASARLTSLNIKKKLKRFYTEKKFLKIS